MEACQWLVQEKQVWGVATAEEARLEGQVVYLDSAWGVDGVLVDLYAVRGSRSGHQHPLMQSCLTSNRQLVIRWNKSSLGV